MKRSKPDASTARRPTQPTPPASLRRLQALISREVLRGAAGLEHVVDERVRALVVGSPAAQDFRLGRYKANYASKMRLALQTIYPVVVQQQPERVVSALVRRFCVEPRSTSPTLVDLRAELRRFLEREARTRPVLRELAALDDARFELLDALATRPRAKTPFGAWLNPNMRLLRARLPLNRIWSNTAEGRRIALRSSATKRSFAIVVTRTGVKVEPVSAAELRALRARTRPRSFDALVAKALVLA